MMINKLVTMKTLKPIAALLMTGVLLIAAGCGTRTPNTAAGSQPAGAPAQTATKWPDVIRLGVLPGEEEGPLSRGNKKFVEDLGKAIGIKTELFVGDDYTAVIEAMRTKKIDIASFGPFSYIIAAERSGAVPFAIKATSKEAAFYNSQIIVPANSKAQKIEDLKGKSFLFADPASTSGHLFPRMMFIKATGIKNDQIEKYFSNVSFSGGHDKSVLAIAKGTADGAGVASSTLKKMLETGLVKESDIRILATSDPIPNSPMTYRKDLPADLVEKIKAFMFEYHKQNPDFFSKGTQAFYPADDKDFQIVRDTAKLLNMSPEELLK